VRNVHKWVAGSGGELLTVPVHNAPANSHMLFRLFTARIACAGLVLSCSLLAITQARAAEIELTLQTRDPDTGKVILTPEKVDPRHVGVIAVDVWNFHWCKTATMRVDAIVPRMNKALDAARALGMTVMLCPSDVVDNYVGYPQREAVFALPKVPVPSVVNVTCPPAHDAGGCACGRERCVVNYGWDGMHPGLRIGEADLMPENTTGMAIYTEGIEQNMNIARRNLREMVI